MKTKSVEQMIDEAMIEKPLTFTMEYTTEKKNIWGKTKRKVRKRKYILYPPTTGKIKALSAVLRGIEIDEAALQEKPIEEGLRLADKYADKVAKIIAIALRNTKEEVLDAEGIAKDAEFIKWHARPESMASLLLIAITQSDFQSLVSVLRLSKKIWLPNAGIEKKERERAKGQTN